MEEDPDKTAPEGEEEEAPAAPPLPDKERDAVFQKMDDIFSDVGSSIKKELSASLGTVYKEWLDGRPDRTVAAKAMASLTEERGAPGAERQHMTPEQIGLYAQALLGRSMGRMIPVEDELVKQALTRGTASSGGYLVDEDWEIDILKHMADRIKIWPMCDVRPTSRDVVRRPVQREADVPDVNVGASAAAEAANITETAITWAELTWTMYRMDAYYPASLELLQDSPIDIYNEITAAASEGFARQREKLPLVGTGSSQATGILVGTGDQAVDTVAISAAITADTLLDLIQDLDEQYRANAAAVMSKRLKFECVLDIAKNIRHVDLLELPKMMESPWMSGTHYQKIVYGDFNYYRIYRRKLMDMVTEVKARSYSVDVAFVERWDGKVTHPKAFRIGTGASY